MITAFKIFEKKERKYNIGDYVICQEDNIPNTFRNFLSNNIGIITGYVASHTYRVEFDEVPENYAHWFDKDKGRPMNNSEIQYSSTNKEDLEKYIYANKFNL
jgi:hypothetical protein